MTIDMYKVALTAVEEMEGLCSRFLRGWLGVPKSFRLIGFYSSSSKFFMEIFVKNRWDEVRFTMCCHHQLTLGRRDWLKT